MTNQEFERMREEINEGKYLEWQTKQPGYWAVQITTMLLLLLFVFGVGLVFFGCNTFHQKSFPGETPRPVEILSKVKSKTIESEEWENKKPKRVYDDEEQVQG